MKYRLDAPLNFMTPSTDLVKSETERVLRTTMAQLRARVEADGVDPHTLLWRGHVMFDEFNTTVSVVAYGAVHELRYDILTIDLQKWLD